MVEDANVPIEAGQDVLHNLDRDDLVERMVVLGIAYNDLFSSIKDINEDVFDRVKQVIVFAPGLSEAQAIIAAFSTVGVDINELRFTLIDGDPKVTQFLSESGLPVELTIHTKSFAEYLDNDSLDKDRSEFIFVCDSGPPTCSSNIGFSNANTNKAVYRLLSDDGLFITRGEVHELVNYLNDTSLLDHLLTKNAKGFRFSPPFNCWQKQSS